MEAILPGVFHWKTFHEGIQAYVHSYYVEATDPAVLIDPRVPAAGLKWFGGHEPPRHVLLTNRHHYRHSGRFEAAFGCRVWCHQDGLHEFTKGEQVSAYEHGDTLPGGIQALEVGVLCPEETALHLPVHGGILALGDAVIRDQCGRLAFVPDFLMGDDPEAVKEGLQEVFRGLLQREFDHLLLAHGRPLVGDGRERLRAFVGRR